MKFPHKCPWCDSDFYPVSDIVFLNVARYGGDSTIKSKCCGLIVRVKRVEQYALYKSGKLTDDWGNHSVARKVLGV